MLTSINGGARREPLTPPFWEYIPWYLLPRPEPKKKSPKDFISTLITHGARMRRVARPRCVVELTVLATGELYSYQAVIMKFNAP